MKIESTNPSKTILTISVGFQILFFATGWEWFVIASVAIGIIGIGSSYLSNKIDWLWMKLAEILSNIIPPLVLGFVFYLILLPVSVLAKAFRRKDLLFLQSRSNSTFKKREKQFDKESFQKPW